jgi:hypothetical protein
MPEVPYDGRMPSVEELAEIERLFEGWFPSYIRVWDNYISDGPGYMGWVAAFVGGEPELGGILIKEEGKIVATFQGGNTYQSGGNDV